ncbi:unnamed protein product, partial [Prorocentrum cordatum]
SDSENENDAAKGKEEMNKCEKELNGEIPGLLGTSCQLLAVLKGLQGKNYAWFGPFSQEANAAVSGLETTKQQLTEQIQG